MRALATAVSGALDRRTDDTGADAEGLVAVRLLTRRDTNTSKGCAFLEFDRAEAVQKALLYHHTMLAGRRINVELTCGGGGGGAARRERIAAKNRRLLAERKVRHEKHIRKGSQPAGVVESNESSAAGGSDRPATGAAPDAAGSRGRGGAGSSDGSAGDE